MCVCVRRERVHMCEEKEYVRERERELVYVCVSVCACVSLVARRKSVCV